MTIAVLDGLPHVEPYDRVDARFATQWWHWFFFTGSPHAGNIGLVFYQCRVTFTFGNPPVYLGRPWHESPSATYSL